MNNIQKALEFATEAHKGQIDREGLPHIFHCVRVASKFTDPNLVVTALLHDTIEDTSVPTQDIYDKFGGFIYDVVCILSRGEEETWEHYIDRVKERTMATQIKIADIEDNIARLPKENKLPMYIEAHRELCESIGRKSKLIASNYPTL